MRRTFYSLVLVLTLATSAVRASMPSPGEALESLRPPLSNALVSATSAVPSNPRLVGAINRAIGLLDRASETNVTTDLSLLSQINSGLARTPVYPDLAGPIGNVTDYFLQALAAGASDSSNRLALAFPSGPHTAASRNLARLYGTLGRADASTNLITFIRLLTQANTSLRVTDKLIVRALAVRPPPASVIARVSYPGGGFSYRSIGAGATPGIGGSFYINSGQTVIVRRLPDMRVIAFTIAGLTPGLNVNVPITAAIASSTKLVPPSSLQFDKNVVGTATVTWSPEARALVGTFTFQANEHTSGALATVTGTLSATY